MYFFLSEETPIYINKIFFIKNKRNILNFKDKNSENNSKIKMNKSKVENSKNLDLIMEFIEDEYNELSYEEALKKDKREYCIYYISLLKTKHNLIFSFFNGNDYNSKIIKIDLFFISFIIYYTINALFFNDDTMHKIYVSNGSFNIENRIPQIIYSSLISMILNIPLKLLALPNKEIICFKQSKNNNKEKIKERYISLIKKLKIKFILYFIFGFILLFLFWFYLSMFSAIYRNTQYHLIKDTLICFGLSLIFPFGIYLLPGLFRIPSLYNKNRICLYNCSKVMQMI